MILITHILSYIQSHWTAWLFALLGLAFGYLFRKLEKQQAENRAVAAGVQSLLRENIVANYNKYQEKVYCPIYAKESISHVYEDTTTWGGNDVATRLYQSVLEMPEDPEEDRQ